MNHPKEATPLPSRVVSLSVGPGREVLLLLLLVLLLILFTLFFFLSGE